MAQATSAHLKLHVQPGTARTGLAGRRGRAFRIRVCDPPSRGLANAAVVNVLAQHPGVHRRDVSIVRGHVSRDKVVRVPGMDADEWLRRLGSEAGGAGTRAL